MTTGPILVTGGSGFIGTNLVEALRGAGREVVSLDVAPPQLPRHRDIWRRVDLLDAAAVESALEDVRPSAVLHLAARTDLEGRTLGDYAANTEGLGHVIDVVTRQPGIRRFVSFSTQLVATPGRPPRHDTDYDPPNLYGRSKVIGEEMVRDELDGRDFVIVRPTSVWGPWANERDRAFFRAVSRGVYVHPRGLDVRKSFGYVANVVHQTIRILDAPAADVRGRVLYLADYEPYPVLEWARTVSRLTTGRPVREAPVAALALAARAGDLLHRVTGRLPPLTSSRLRNLTTTTVFDLEDTRRVCGPLPVSMEEGTALTLAWMAEHDRS